MRESIVAAQHYPFPFVTNAYTDETVMKMTFEVDNNMIPLLGVRTNKISPWNGTTSVK